MKPQMALILPDIHYPRHNKRCLKAIFNLLKDVGQEVKYLILLGDQMEFECVSHWMKDKKRPLEGKRLKKDYESFNKEILTPLEKAVHKDAKKVYFIGNHEDWVRQAIDENPQGEGFWEIDINLKLEERGWKIIPLNEIWKLGKLWLIHGVYYNQYHAAKTVITYGHSIIYGHTHDLQEFTKVTPADVEDVHKGKSIGCLSDINPSYKRGFPNRYVNAFSIVYLYNNGWFNEYTINIMRGGFVWNGKFYSGR
jgi:predicted phosphodiesterase